MPANITVAQKDLLTFNADIVILKYANANRGFDLAVAKALDTDNLKAARGEYAFFSTQGKLGAPEVLMLGVGALHEFEYREIESFAQRALEIISRERPAAEKIAITIHGPGYGLDELASVDSLIKGLKAGAASFGGRNVEIFLVEKWQKRAERVRDYLSVHATSVPGDFTPGLAETISHGGNYDKRLFACMPFSEDFLDHWELALRPAAHETGMLLERLDHNVVFTGDIVEEIRNRISKSAAVVALLDGSNPNVFLEVGYAWGVRKPTILALHKSSEPPFDVRSQRILRYGRLGELKSLLSTELKGLADHGAL